MKKNEQIEQNEQNEQNKAREATAADMVDALYRLVREDLIGLIREKNDEGFIFALPGDVKIFRVHVTQIK